MAKELNEVVGIGEWNCLLLALMACEHRGGDASRNTPRLLPGGVGRAAI